MTEPVKSRPPIRLLISDIDGTLLTHEKVLTPGAIAAVQKLKDAGIRFTLTSSRPPRGMKSQITALNVTEPIAAFNGGMIVQPDSTVLKKRLVPGDVAAKVIKIISDFRLSAWLFTDRDWFVRDPNGPHVDREQHTVNFLATVVADFNAVLDQAGKIVGVSDDFDAVVRCEKAIHAECGNSLAASRSQPYYLDVTHPQANKGQAVLDLSDVLKIPTEQIATIGDMPADVFMFAKSGISIAMGNSSPEVKAAATFVTDSNDEEGFAKAIDRFILQQAAIAEVR
ncbi:MAG: haloacid dehalogenase [Acidobacteriales bacterium]|nr:haloacid dehalogenase [Terriglobales bacterium]